jgi:O-antigen ligase
MIYAVAGKAGFRNFCNQVFRVRDLTPTNEIESLKNRDLSRQIAWQSIRDRPLSGIGLATFGALSQYQFLRENGEWQTVNNQYLEIVVELGLVGLMIFLAIVFLAIRYQVLAVGNGKYENVVYLGWLLAVLVQYLTFSTLYLLYIWIFLAIIWPTNKQDLA